MGELADNTLKDIYKSLDVIDAALNDNKPPEVRIIQEKIEYFCGILQSLSREEAKKYSQDLEVIGARVSEIYSRIQKQKEEMERKISGLSNEAAAHAAYRKNPGY